jgi:DNA repair protein RadC
MDYHEMSTAELQRMASEVCDEIATRKIGQPSNVLPSIKKYAGKTKEHFFTVTLDGSHHVVKVHTVSIGTVNRAIVHPREVFEHAIRDNATAIIIGHNHPSGNLEVSVEDTAVVKQMVEAGKVLGIMVLDHITISKAGYSSELKKGTLPQ